MNEKILNKDGTVTVVGDAGSVAGIIADLVKANTVPAERDLDGVETKAAIVPNADTLAIEVRITPLEQDDDGNDIPDSRPLLQTHEWRLPKARTERLADTRGARNAKLKELDLEYQRADEGSHPTNKTKVAVAAEKQVLRDLPPIAEAALELLNNTDDIEAYLPIELQ
tara:strand:- start:1762 stop:2265 length:504 start_codon:yes stop_codon:yes gene_type:complete